MQGREGAPLVLGRLEASWQGGSERKRPYLDVLQLRAGCLDEHDSGRVLVGRADRGLHGHVQQQRRLGGREVRGTAIRVGIISTRAVRHQQSGDGYQCGPDHDGARGGHETNPRAATFGAALAGRFRRSFI